MKGRTLGSLFTGIRGLDLGLEAAGLHTIWTCDNDEACQRVIERTAPGLPVIDDVAKVGEELEPPDVLAGGFPCPDFSVAGRRLLFEGERAQLWYEMARAVRVLRPKLVVVENVSGLLAAFGVVLADLAEAGYVGRWVCLRASDVGAPHRRERLFVVAADPGQPGVDADRLLRGGDPAGWHRSGGALVPARPEVARPADTLEDCAGPPPNAERERRHRSGAGDEGGPAEGRPNGRAEPPRPPEAAPDPGRPGRREPPQQDLRQEAGVEAPLRRDSDRRTRAAPDSDGMARQEAAERDDGRGEGEPVVSPPPAGGAGSSEWGAYGAAVERWTRIFGREPPRPTDDRGRLSPGFVEWMLGFPEGWTEGEERRVRLRMLGNSVQVQVAELVGLIAAEALD